MTQPQTAIDPTAALPYASPAPRGLRVWSGAVILGGGLGLIALGGCFLVGVLAITSPNVVLPSAKAAPLTGPEIVLMIFLYLLAFACFAGAMSLLFLGTRGLLRILRGS